MTDDVQRIRVLLVDDHAVVRMGLRAFFDLLPDIDVVGEASDGSEGVAMARRLTPDVVLMDLLMPNMDGVTAIGRIKAELPETEIVTMTSFIEEEKVTAALEAGASGYVLKDAEAEEVAQAIRAAYAGEVHLDPQVARLLAQRMRAKKDPEPVEPLTEREKDVMRLLGQGMSNKEIGAAAVHHGAHRADLRVQHPRQARARVAHPGRAVGRRAQAGRARQELTPGRHDRRALARTSLATPIASVIRRSRDPSDDASTPIGHRRRSFRGAPLGACSAHRNPINGTGERRPQRCTARWTSEQVLRYQDDLRREAAQQPPGLAAKSQAGRPRKRTRAASSVSASPSRNASTDGPVVIDRRPVRCPSSRGMGRRRP